VAGGRAPDIRRNATADIAAEKGIREIEPSSMSHSERKKRWNPNR
jgi:hypothetical protein